MRSVRQQWQARDASAKKPAVRRTPSMNAAAASAQKSAADHRRQTAQRWTAHFEKYDLKHKLARVLAADPDLAVLDLSSNTQFLALSSVQKSRVVDVLSKGASLERVVLCNLKLDNSNMAALVRLLRSPRLKQMVLDSNSLTEAAILQLAGEIRGHPAIAHFSIADQRSPLSTLSIQRLIEAMEETPNLLRLGLGTLRDNGMRWRLQAATMANTEKMRQRRRGAASYRPRLEHTHTRSLLALTAGSPPLPSWRGSRCAHPCPARL